MVIRVVMSKLLLTDQSKDGGISSDENVPSVVKGLGFGHLLLQRSFIQCTLAVLDKLSDDTGQTLLELAVGVKVVFVEPLENGHIGIIRGLLEVLPPGEIVIQIDPYIHPTQKKVL